MLDLGRTLPFRGVLTRAPQARSAISILFYNIYLWMGKNLRDGRAAWRRTSPSPPSGSTDPAGGTQSPLKRQRQVGEPPTTTSPEPRKCTICTPNDGPESSCPPHHRHIYADLTLGQDLTLPGHACVSRQGPCWAPLYYYNSTTTTTIIQYSYNLYCTVLLLLLLLHVAFHLWSISTSCPIWPPFVPAPVSGTS